MDNFRKTANEIFSKFNLFLASNKKIGHLKELGAKNIIYNGNIKLLSEIDIEKINNKNEKILLTNKFWLSASTHDGEEEFSFKTHLFKKKNLIKFLL